MKNEVLMRSSRNLKFERCRHFHSIEQPLINLDLKYFILQIKLRYLKSILQTKFSLNYLKLNFAVSRLCSYLVLPCSSVPYLTQGIGLNRLLSPSPTFTIYNCYCCYCYCYCCCCWWRCCQKCHKIYAYYLLFPTYTSICVMDE